MSARQEIMDRLRGALKDAPKAPPIPQTHRLKGDLDTEALIEQHVDRLLDYKAGVRTIDASALPETLADLLSGATSYVVPPGLEPAWLDHPALANDSRRRTDSIEAPLTLAELDATAAVLTSSTVSVAESGTIVLDGDPDQGRRAISLIPDHHICVVAASSIVQILPEALPRLDSTRPQTWISGPSATSDIELERVEGVHGPRRLDVVIVRDL
ncbi:LutC/YkgG family protein [Zafaria sp. Z1313]|uniref:LutC/YkgG family protein n=1 Tax=unclassified Zafaria TaxID=2828765 RepID=UPI002E79CD35|nr:LUD domain-containing protein [Zafaria sp. J156]MEE1622718.1 LUD domain-containing protein [Zafaria sp. J156]